jgi:hypothetical protein
MDTYPTKLMEAFASQALEIFYQSSVADAITNNDYEGEIRNKSSKLNVLTFAAIGSHAYTGATMTADDPTESNCQLVTDQCKYFYFKIKDYDTFRSYLKNPENPIKNQVANELKKVIDVFVLGLYGDVGAGNRVGTSYTTGTVTVATGTGVVTGAAGASWDSTMIGKGFKALGHTSWYRITAVGAADSLTIVDDSDDLTAAYTGGAIAGGATYEIQANTAVVVTKDTIFSKVSSMQTTLTNAEIPAENRWLAVPSRVAALIRQSPEWVGVGSEGGREAVQNGLLPGKYCGFDVYEVSDARISGAGTSTTNGYHVIGGHKSAITFAMGLTEQGIEDLIGNFGKAYKSLYVYGAKVADERRKALVELYCYVA